MEKLNLKNTMLDSFEIHEILHRQYKSVADINQSVNPSSDFQKFENNLNDVPCIVPPITNKVKPIKWWKILLWGGAIALGIYFINLPRNENYKSFSERRRLRTNGL